MDISSLLTARHPTLTVMLEKEHKLILSGVGNPTAKTFLAGTFLLGVRSQESGVGIGDLGNSKRSQYLV
jgi:hypothetical protein